MSWQACKHVWNNSKQTGGLKLTLLAIAEHATEKNGWTCCAAIETLADMVGVSDRQIKKNLTKLEELGELKISRNIGRGNTNIYDISYLVKGELEDIKGELQDTFYEQEKVNSSTEKVNSRVIKGELQDTQTNRTKKEPKEESTAVTRTAKHFGELSGKTCSQDQYNRDWLPFIEKWVNAYGEAKTKDRIKKALDFASGNNEQSKRYTIASPKSLDNILTNLSTNSNGHTNGINQPPVIQPPTDEEQIIFERLLANATKQ